MLHALAMLPLGLAPAQTTAPSNSRSDDAPQGPSVAAPAPRWTHALDWLRDESDAFGADLARAKELLLARAERDAPDLAATLRGSPPPHVERGYGVLPRLLADPGLAGVTPRRQAYSLEGISTVYAWAMRDAAVLARVAGEEAEPLDVLVKNYERLRSKHANLEEHIAYHEYWQQQVIAEASFFAERNSVLTLIEEWDRLRRGDSDATKRCADLRGEWFGRLAPFEPTAGLTIERREDGLVLPVTVVTDIADEAFLAAFEAAVAAAFNDAPAAAERGFRVELTVERIAPEDLYPNGAPKRTSEVDEAEHVARFPANALVLTTGAASTHSYVGRSIVLGADPIPPRTLAHEFGHLLGFRDAYLRAFEGDPNGPFGATLVEWTGLLDDLMGDARRGRVTPEMVERVISAYAEPELRR